MTEDFLRKWYQYKITKGKLILAKKKKELKYLRKTKLKSIVQQESHCFLS